LPLPLLCRKRAFGAFFEGFLTACICLLHLFVDIGNCMLIVSTCTTPSTNVEPTTEPR
jgi:hypothetical protein